MDTSIMARAGLSAHKTPARALGGIGASEAFSWESILYLYCAYIGIIFVGGVAGVQTTVYGAALFLMLLYARYGKHLFRLEMSLTAYCVLLSIFIPLIPMVSFDGDMFAATWRDLIKYWALYLVMLIGLCLPLTPLPRAKRSWMLYGVVLTFLVAGWVWSVATGVHWARVKGFMVNPNGFAMTAMMLLMLIDDGRKSLLVRVVNHTVVLLLIYVTHTGGAFFGYFAGMFYRFVLVNKRYSVVMRAVLISVMVVVALTIFFTIPPKTSLIVDKVRVAVDNIGSVFSGEQIQYYEIIEREGQNATSGLWRLTYWSRLWGEFWSSSVDKILFGHGIGTTVVLFKMKPHNDYLRLLMETGLLGFTFFIAAWVTIYRRMETKFRWVVIMVAVFCFSENNYDHFPAMSLLVFYMLGACKSTIKVDRQLPRGMTGRVRFEAD